MAVVLGVIGDNCFGRQKNYFGVFLKQGHWNAPGMTYPVRESCAIWHRWRSMPKNGEYGNPEGMEEQADVLCIAGGTGGGR